MTKAEQQAIEDRVYQRVLRDLATALQTAIQPPRKSRTVDILCLQRGQTCGRREK